MTDVDKNKIAFNKIITNNKKEPKNKHDFLVSDALQHRHFSIMRKL